MKTCVHPSSNIRYTVEHYVAEYGPKLDASGQERRRPTLVCPSCSQPMQTVAESGPVEEATWSHRSAKNALWCPLREEDGAKYTLQAPKTLNTAESQKIRERFFSNWQLHWSHVLELAPMCDISAFIRFIEHADSIRFWAHGGLQEWHIPYVFLATHDFPPSKKKTAVLKDDWIRYRFNSRVRNTSDLWLRTVSNWGFTRARYKAPPQGAVPGIRHLIDVDQIEPDPLFLRRVAPKDEKFYDAKMKMYFPTELR